MSAAKNDIHIPKHWLILLSFIEGGAVMGAEISGAKMLAPYFGTSLYVWSSVMAVTLGGLACGYYSGGVWSEKPNKTRKLLYIVLAASVFIMLMPYSCNWILLSLPSKSLFLPLILTGILFLFPPIFLMGAVSPMIISILTSYGGSAGKASGSLFAISTMGGICATFLFGFYLIPEFGLSRPCIINGIIFSLIPVFFLFKGGIKSSVLVTITGIALFTNLLTQTKPSAIKVLFAEEGLHGQMLVTEYENQNTKVRQLMVNRVVQAFESIDERGVTRNFEYIHRAAEVIPDGRGKRALLLGLGGGCVAKLLKSKGYITDAVDLDPRMEMISKKYFGSANSFHFIKDDARHFIRNYRGPSYDLIFFDVFKAEEIPSHLITIESVAEIKKITSKNAFVMLNTNGFLQGPESCSNASIIRTIKEGGITFKYLATGEIPEQRNILLCNGESLSAEWKQPDQKLLMSGFVLEDDHPRMEKINQAAMLIWRQQYISEMIKPFSEFGIPLFF